MKPTTGSPGSGEQHFANRTRTSSSPATLIPELDVRRVVTLRIKVFNMLSGFGADSASPFFAMPGSASITCCVVILP
jgi:hypothetical protein